jgi:hypothetical protein
MSSDTAKDLRDLANDIATMTEIMRGLASDQTAVANECRRIEADLDGKISRREFRGVLREAAVAQRDFMQIDAFSHGKLAVSLDTMADRARDIATALRTLAAR